jgi:beta-alanine degradation protein BauB
VGRIATFGIGTFFGVALTAGIVYAKQSTMDPVKLSPQYYTVRIDNDRVRVLEYHLPTGQQEPMHAHPAGVVFATSSAKFRTTLPDGSVTESEGKAGEVFWRDATTHALENIGNTEASALAVELKPCGH